MRMSAWDTYICPACSFGVEEWVITPTVEIAQLWEDVWFDCVHTTYTVYTAHTRTIRVFQGEMDC
jgi:hypothetical protein